MPGRPPLLAGTLSMTSSTLTILGVIVAIAILVVVLRTAIAAARRFMRHLWPH
jgi:hypothetical protein